MDTSEQVLGIIEGLQSKDGPFLDYNLVLTTKRLVLIHARSLRIPEVGLAKGWLWGWTPSVSELDELLQKNDCSFAINYEEIDGIKLHKGLLESKLVVESRDSKRIFVFDKNFKKIHTMLLQALDWKVSVSK